MSYIPDNDRNIDTYKRLTDGSVYRLRPSGPDDRELLIRCFEALSPESRRMRFFAHKETLTADDLERFCDTDGHDHIAFAAVRIDESGRELEPLGFARCMRLTPGGEVAELSIATSDKVQGQGVGSALLSRLSEAARARGVRRFWFEVLAENESMRRLAHRLGGEASWVGSGIVEYECTLPESAPSVRIPRKTVPAPRPAMVEAGQTVPWYLNPDTWWEPWTETWRANLDDCLDWVQAANEELVSWLDAA